MKNLFEVANETYEEFYENDNKRGYLVIGKQKLFHKSELIITVPKYIEVFNGNYYNFCIDDYYDIIFNYPFKIEDFYKFQYRCLFWTDKLTESEIQLLNLLIKTKEEKNVKTLLK